jgi:hypothetical protein
MDNIWVLQRKQQIGFSFELFNFLRSSNHSLQSHLIKNTKFSLTFFVQPLNFFIYWHLFHSTFPDRLSNSSKQTNKLLKNKKAEKKTVPKCYLLRNFQIPVFG